LLARKPDVAAPARALLRQWRQSHPLRLRRDCHVLV